MAANHDFECEAGHEFDHLFESSEYVVDWWLCDCGRTAKRVWRRFPALDPLVCLWSGRMVNGRMVYSRKELLESYKDAGLIPCGEGDNMEAEIKKNKQYREQEMAAEIDKKAEQYVASGEIYRDLSVMKEKVEYLQKNGPDALDGTPDQI